MAKPEGVVVNISFALCEGCDSVVGEAPDGLVVNGFVFAATEEVTDLSEKLPLLFTVLSHLFDDCPCECIPNTLGDFGVVDLLFHFFREHDKPHDDG
jgi:hypothetical protein